KWVGITYRWVSSVEISPWLFRALIAAEDARFLQHYGFDWHAIEQAQRRNERLRGRRLYGASTISMQTAKNAFLLPTRTYIRKAFEAYFTVLIETFWGKRRILEVYANIVEWGNGMYGTGAAARRYFGKSARELSPHEAALLAAVLPNPRRWSPAAPTPYIQRRSAWVRARMGIVPVPRL
ncbi:MAG: monofunctional biosynthetic peptidoglycan transglycosylase, partial [Candidatus Kapabacteria bacterium]|nr:monofunctional biosynthetic peptidoglycan transglycosylase [Candidatus Kapabacteria bacterium]MDW8225698.1 monofunctional biosynthetic peptidoglycan transglycosylase [Bacteroidota bacterium]